MFNSVNSSAPISPSHDASLNSNNLIPEDCSYMYECSVCGMDFPNAQALGGHGNAHRKRKDDPDDMQMLHDHPENNRDSDHPVSFVDPLRWAPPAHSGNDEEEKKDGDDPNGIIILRKSGLGGPFEFVHYLPKAGDLNRDRAGLGLGFSSFGGGSGSGTKRPWDDDEARGYNCENKKAVKYGHYDDYDLKFVRPSDFSLPIGGVSKIDELELTLNFF